MIVRMIFSITLILISFYLIAIGLNTWGMVVGVIGGFLLRKVINNVGL
jgi:hypothetical protein